MKERMYCYTILVCISAFVFGAEATTVMIDPAISNSSEVGEALDINVKIEDVTDLFGYQFDLAFDNTALKFSNIQSGEFLGSDGTDKLVFLNVNDRQVYFDADPDILALLMATGETVESEITPDIAAEVNTAGRLTVVGTRIGNTANISGTGMLATISFEVLEIKDSALELENVELGSSQSDSEAQFIETDTENGVVVVPEIKGDVNNDGEVNSEDAILALRMAVELDKPSEMADMNNDGKVGADDVILILRAAIGLAAPDLDSLANTSRHITIVLGKSHGIAGQSVEIPVKIDSAAILAGGNLAIGYNQAVLRAVKVISNPDIMTASKINEPGTVHIAFAGANNPDKKNSVRINFDIIADDISPLTFKSVKLYDRNALPLISRCINGEFTSWAIPPKRSALLQNFPNPFNPDTWIPYQLSAESEVSIAIYDATGRIVRRLNLGQNPAGVYQTKDRAAHWDGRNASGEIVVSGIYFVVLKAGNFQSIRSIALVR